MPISPLMFVSAFFLGALSAYLAHKRRRNPYTWFILGFLFGIFGIFAIFFASSKRKATKRKTAHPAPKPVLTIQGPIDKFWYYLDPSHQQQGPMSRDAITTIWREGKIDLSTLIWHEELPTWQPLKETLNADC